MCTALLLSLFMVQAPPPTTTPKPAPAPATPAQPRPQPRRAATPAPRSGLTITVTDAKGATIPAVAVEVTGPTPRKGETDSGGQVNFPGLQAGTYRVRFSGETVIGFEREVTIRAGQIADLDITLTPAPPPRVVAAPPSPPPAPAAAATVGPQGQPQILSLVDLVERELVANNVPRKDTLVACSGNTRSMLVQLNQPQAQRVYDSAEALYYVIAGEGSITIAGRDVQLQAGSYASVPRGATHALTRKGRRPLIVLAVLSGEPCEEAR
jgi:mannose-6-phosphate isomerase-like protein (cupin superfamily)